MRSSAPTPIEHGHCCRDQRLQKFEPVAEGWYQTIKSYCVAFERYEQEDAPYYYNERANISVLARGAWKSRMFTLEEYPTEKTRDDGVRRTGSHRCDLMIWDDESEFQIEAKQCWLRTALPDDSHEKRVTSMLKAARSDADRNTDSKSRLGCVFFSVWWPQQSEYSRDPSIHIRRELDRLLSYEASLWAWPFPKETRLLVSTESDGSRRFYPGVVMGLTSGKYARFS